ncbi:DUF6279 family lipoprotein [Granulosicoccus sp. 3-233]|uniref:DUF6279 family lipoprotein n=1 Tax=Granulosicoccus sp. 3-233 TaxID=3417969 RepID=UPI003D3365B4
MITTTQGQRETTQRSAHWRNVSILLGLVLLLSACTNSRLIISPLYNRLDDRIRSEFHKLGDFNEEQTAAFEQALGTFHVWHRQSELPRYAALLAQIADSIARPGVTTANDVKSWMQRAEAFSLEARQCYPANFLAGTVRTLSDEQLIRIERRFKNERSKNRERYASRTPEERVEFRLERLDKWLGRIQLNLNTSQRQLLRESLSRQTSLRKQYYTLSDRWNRRLFNLARQQDRPDYEPVLQDHMATLWSLLESHYPKQWQANRDLWQTTVLELVNSLSEGQRRQASQWLATMGRTLLAVSKVKPSFQVGTDPGVGCLVAQSGVGAGQ